MCKQNIKQEWLSFTSKERYIPNQIWYRSFVGQFVWIPETILTFYTFESTSTLCSCQINLSCGWGYGWQPVSAQFHLSISCVEVSKVWWASLTFFNNCFFISQQSQAITYHRTEGSAFHPFIICITTWAQGTELSSIWEWCENDEANKL